MRKEFAILKGIIDEALDGDCEVVFKNQYPEYILAELIRLDDDGYTIEEYVVDDDGEFVEGSDFDTVASFKNRYGTWYAVCADDDNDWSVGSYNKTEAIEMLQKMPASYRICVIEMGTDPTCVDIICND